MIRTAARAAKAVRSAGTGSSVPPLVAFVTGLSGAGKTTLCAELQDRACPDICVITTDWYIKHASSSRSARIRQALASRNEHALATEVDPFLWVDWHAFRSDLRTLLERGILTIDRAYDQRTGTKRTSVRIEWTVRPRILLCDGLYVVHPANQGLADCTILVDTPSELCDTRLQRRYSNRHSDDYVPLRQWLQDTFNRPFIDAVRSRADIVVTNVNGERRIVRPRAAHRLRDDSHFALLCDLLDGRHAESLAKCG